MKLQELNKKLELLYTFIGNTTDTIYYYLNVSDGYIYVNNEYSYLVIDYETNGMYTIDLKDLINSIKIFNVNDEINVYNNDDLVLFNNNKTVRIEKYNTDNTLVDQKYDNVIEIDAKQFLKIVDSNSNIGSIGDNMYDNIVYTQNGFLYFISSTYATLLISKCKLLSYDNLITSFNYSFLRHLVKCLKLLDIKGKSLKLMKNDKVTTIAIDNMKFIFLNKVNTDFESYKLVGNINNSYKLATLNVQELREIVKKLYIASNTSYLGNYLKLDKTIWLGFKKNGVESKLNLPIEVSDVCEININYVSLYKFLNTLNNKHIDFVRYNILYDTLYAFETNDHKYMII